jgi:26S proteasome subunit RPN7
MAPYYRYITSTSDSSTSASSSTNPTAPLAFDARLHEEMAAQNKEELERLDARLAEAEKTEGESEIGDALRARAIYLTRIGDKVCVYILMSFSCPALPPHLFQGKCSVSPCSRSREDAWFRVQNRPRPNPRTGRLLFF